MGLFPFWRDLGVLLADKGKLPRADLVSPFVLVNFRHHRAGAHSFLPFPRQPGPIFITSPRQASPVGPGKTTAFAPVLQTDPERVGRAVREHLADEKRVFFFRVDFAEHGVFALANLRSSFPRPQLIVNPETFIFIFQVSAWTR